MPGFILVEATHLYKIFLVSGFFIQWAFVLDSAIYIYPRIPHTAGLAALRDALDNRQVKKIATEDLVKMAEFVLKNDYFEFNESIKQQISGTAIGTKFAPPYACIFMDKLETNFLKTSLITNFGVV